MENILLERCRGKRSDQTKQCFKLKVWDMLSNVNYESHPQVLSGASWLFPCPEFTWQFFKVWQLNWIVSRVANLFIKIFPFRSKFYDVSSDATLKYIAPKMNQLKILRKWDCILHFEGLREREVGVTSFC